MSGAGSGTILDSDDEDEHLRFTLRLLIRHPSIDPAAITERLGLMPRVAQTAGAPRMTPRGTRLLGVNEGSVWGHSRRIEGTRYFFDEMAKMLDELEPHARFLAELSASGGDVCFIVHLAGDTNIGDVISSESLALIAALGASLGVEVFPEFGDVIAPALAPEGRPH